MAGLVPAIPLSASSRIVRQYYLYILASRSGGAIYHRRHAAIVIRRVYEHRNGFVEGLTKRFHIHQLVYFEIYVDSARRNSTREEHETLAARVEDSADHADQPDMARFVRGRSPSLEPVLTLSGMAGTSPAMTRWRGSAPSGRRSTSYNLRIRGPLSSAARLASSASSRRRSSGTAPGCAVPICCPLSSRRVMSSSCSRLR